MRCGTLGNTRSVGTYDFGCNGWLLLAITQRLLGSVSEYLVLSKSAGLVVSGFDALGLDWLLVWVFGPGAAVWLGRNQKEPKMITDSIITRRILGCFIPRIVSYVIPWAQFMKAAKQHPEQMKKRLILLTISAVALFVAVLAYNNSSSPKDNAHTSSNSITKPDASKPAQPRKIRLIATGDMLPHDTVNQAARTSDGYDYKPLFSKISQYLTSGDMAYCNQESPSASQFRVSGYPTFNAPKQFATDLSTEGCNIINLANNHADDKGQAGINATLDVWKTLPTLAVAGTATSQANQNKVSVFSVKGVKFAFLSYAQCSNNRGVSSYGLNIFSQDLASSQIAAARAAKVDMIIAAMHSCREERSMQDNWQDQTAQFFANKGVDIVIGTGPHWLQPVKQLAKAGGGKTVVWFSLGNMLSSQLEVNGLIGGIAVMDIDVTTHSVSNVGFMPTYMHYEWTPAQAARQDTLSRHNLMLYPLDQAATALARSQNHTTVSAQNVRVTKLLNTYTHVDMLTSKTFSSYGK